MIPSEYNIRKLLDERPNHVAHVGFMVELYMDPDSKSKTRSEITTKLNQLVTEVGMMERELTRRFKIDRILELTSQHDRVKLLNTSASEVDMILRIEMGI